MYGKLSQDLYQWSSWNKLHSLSLLSEISMQIFFWFSIASLLYFACIDRTQKRWLEVYIIEINMEAHTCKPTRKKSFYPLKLQAYLHNI